MRKTAMLTLGLLLSAGLWGGCGSSDGKGSSAADARSGGKYCATLKAAKADITKYTGGTVPDTAGFATFLTEVDTLASQAPSDVADDWQTLQTALKGLTDALDEAGVTLDQLAEAMQTNRLPDGVTVEDFQKLGQKLQSLSGAEFDTATAAITDQAKKVCGLSISMS